MANPISRKTAMAKRVGRMASILSQTLGGYRPQNPENPSGACLPARI
jgi:hypothetical protein